MSHEEMVDGFQSFTTGPVHTFDLVTDMTITVLFGKLCGSPVR